MQNIAFGYDSSSMKLRQGEKIIVNIVTATKVSTVASRMMIIMKGIEITSKMDLTKLKKRLDFIIWALHSYKSTDRKLNPPKKYQLVSCRSSGPKSSFICRPNNTNDHICI